MNALVWYQCLAQMIKILHLRFPSSSCWLAERTPGRDNVSIKRLTSITLLPLVKPLDLFKPAIRVCSIQRSGETPNEQVLVLRTTNNPLWNSLRIRGRNSVISCTNQNNDLLQLLWPVPAKVKLTCILGNKCACPSSLNVLPLN